MTKPVCAVVGIGPMNGAKTSGPSSRKMAVVDWQNCAVSRGIWDVSRFCVLSLSIDTRRTVARNIVELYVDTLAQHGVRNYPTTRAWDDYEILLPLQFAQQLRFYGTIQHWDDNQRHWVATTAPPCNLRSPRYGGISVAHHTGNMEAVW